MKITVVFNLYNAREKFLSAQHLLSVPLRLSAHVKNSKI